MPAKATPPARLVDIAAQANVSKMTVARVLHGSGAGHVRVSQKTAQRIRQIARDMQYQPNKLAQKLAGGQSHSLGVIVDSHAPLPILRTLQQVERQAILHGYRVMVSQMHDDPDALVTSYHELKRHGVDGVICMSHDYPQLGDSHYASLRHEPNLVFLGRPQVTQMPHVEVRDDLGVLQAMAHLRSRGRRRIAMHLYPTGSHCMKQRLAGYQQALAEAGTSGTSAEAPAPPPTQAPLIIHTPRPDDPGLLREHAIAIADALIEHQADAVIASNDLIAGYLIQTLTQRGVRVPQDIAIVGHDNQDFTDCFSPSITSLDHNCSGQAQAVVALCLALIRSGTCPDDLPLAIQPTLVVRESA